MSHINLLTPLLPELAQVERREPSSVLSSYIKWPLELQGRVNGINRKRIYSDVFDIGRGVVQGDIISPVLFWNLTSLFKNMTGPAAGSSAAPS